MALDQESHKFMDASKLKGASTTLLLLLALVGSNFVTLYVFSWRPYANANRQFTVGIDPERFYFSTLLSSLVSQLNHTQVELQRTQQEIYEVKVEVKKAFVDLSNVFLEALSRNTELINASKSRRDTDETTTDPWMRWARLMKDHSISKELQEFISVRKLPFGWSHGLASDSLVSPVGHHCALEVDDLKKFMEYDVGKECPDDQALAHRLTVHGCEPLPRRRCFATIPPNFTEPYPLPESLWTIPSDNSILWTPYTCKSFECLNDRKNHGVFEDCIDCFELHGREKSRWTNPRNDLDFSIDEVLELKKGTIRIGLDIGGGVASFAVRMREKNVTIVTTTLNLNGPFNNFVALRGVVPLFLTITQRLPFFDNTLDIVHSMHVLSNWIPTETLEFVLFDIDRILRPGGLFWLDHFFCVRPQLSETYVPLIEKLGYNKLKWVIGDKLDRGPELQEVYVSALLEKPISRSSSR